ncbi:hypothetical protein [Paraburkholderia humisilvae]|uniref:Uncharacterized protein n=1 Tax=Paraburkholderia humisilvae TaxID=627669 RepID=A0A6J5E4J8_9BURK|nr:hypothetical protein [Paraburkholderia humisilvae]CAB3760035.1 hypothetical protein LMG29542_03734 [Paraburkholderia humisilvae]
MKTPNTRAPGKRPTRAKYLRTVGFALAISCIFATTPLRAEDAHRGDQRHSGGHAAAPRQAYRHDDHRHDNRYGDRDQGYGYSAGAPPLVYAPVAAPGINLFLPL